MGQLHRWFIVESRTGVNQFGSLIAQRLNDHTRGVTQAIHRPPLHPVKIATILPVKQIRSFAANKGNVGRGVVGIRLVLLCAG